MVEVNDAPVASDDAASTPQGTVKTGDIVTGVWKATPVGVTWGGTGRSTFAANAVLYGNTTSGLLATSVNAAATNKFLRQVSSGAPSFQTLVAGDIPALSYVKTDGNSTVGTPYTTSWAGETIDYVTVSGGLGVQVGSNAGIISTYAGDGISANN
jgi:hypothetical protein